MKKVNIYNGQMKESMIIGEAFEIKPILNSLWKASFKNDNIWFPFVEKPKLNKYRTYAIHFQSRRYYDRIEVIICNSDTVMRILNDSISSNVFWHDM